MPDVARPVPAPAVAAPAPVYAPSCGSPQDAYGNQFVADSLFGTPAPECSASPPVLDPLAAAGTVPGQGTALVFDRARRRRHRSGASLRRRRRQGRLGDIPARRRRDRGTRGRVTRRKVWLRRPERLAGRSADARRRHHSVRGARLGAKGRGIRARSSARRLDAVRRAWRDNQELRGGHRPTWTLSRRLCHRLGTEGRPVWVPRRRRSVGCGSDFSDMCRRRRGNRSGHCGGRVRPRPLDAFRPLTAPAVPHVANRRTARHPVLVCPRGGSGQALQGRTIPGRTSTP